jgi:hypothetical protein
MQRKRKDDTGRFVQAIAAFSAAPEKVTPRGRLLNKDAKSSLHAIATEINETVLRRTLVLRTSSGKELVLDVGERRVLEVPALPAGTKESQAGLESRSLSEDDTPAFLDLLRDFAQDESEISVFSQLQNSTGKSGFGGISAPKLLDWLAEVPSLNLPEPCVAALEASKVSASAVLLAFGEDRPFSWGGAEALTQLEGIARAWPDPQDMSGRVTLWAGDMEEGEAILVAPVATGLVFLLCPMTEALACFRLWQEVNAN